MNHFNFILYSLYLFIQARSIISAALRLNIIGPYESQQVLLEAGDMVLETLEKYKSNAGIPYQTSPLLDITQGLHDKLYSRMFNS